VILGKQWVEGDRVGDLLRNFGAMIPLTLIAVPYGLIVWPLLTAYRRRHGSPRTARLTAGTDVTIALLGVLVLCLVLMPVGDSHSSTLHLMPGEDIRSVFGDNGSFLQVGGNLLMLSPLGALLPMRVPWLRSLLKVALAAMIASMLVEGTQYLIHAGRVTATDDVLLNSTGALLGASASRRWWTGVRLVPIPIDIPVQTRRVPVCESPSLNLRVPRSVWDARCAGVGFASNSLARGAKLSEVARGHPTSTRNA
jgi:hypothetical protein